RVCSFELYRPVRAVRTGLTGYRYADRPLPGGTPGISRIGRYGDISGGNGRNFDRYRSAQLGNGRFRPLPPGTARYRSDRIPVRGPPCIGRYYFLFFLLIKKYFLMLGDVTE
ncbi:unnamed protein product, partial [Musa textilis]